MKAQAASLAVAMATIQGADVVPEGADMRLLMQTLLLAPDLRPVRGYILAKSELAFGLPMRLESTKSVTGFEASAAPHTLRFAQEAAALTRRLLRQDRINELQPAADAGLDVSTYQRDFALRPEQARQLIDGLQGGIVPPELVSRLRSEIGSANYEAAMKHYFTGKQAATEIAKLNALNENDLPPSEAEALAKADREVKAAAMLNMIEEREREMASIEAARKQAAAAEERLKALA